MQNVYKKLRNNLSQRQLQIIDAIIKYPTIEDAMKKTNASPIVIRRYFANAAFRRELSKRLDLCRQQSQILLNKFVHSAAVKLISLTQDRSGEVARKACIDIITMEKQLAALEASANAVPASHANFSTTVATKLLRVLAKDRAKKDKKRKYAWKKA